MKEICKKISKALKTVFGYGILVCLFAGGLTFFGYMAALVIGGETAAAICHFIYKQFMPVVIWCTSLLIVLGLAAMYLAGEKSLTFNKQKK